MIGLSSLDAYTLRARLLPAVIATAPALALVAIYVSWEKFALSQLLVTIALFTLLVVFSDIARRQGKRIEPILYKKMGGKPTTIMLRRCDTTLNEKSKARIHAVLATRLNEPSPTPEEEAAHPDHSDTFYERGGDWLRENTRDSKRFKLVYEENMTYGFRRNLLGMKWLGLGLNSLVLLISASTFYIPLPSLFLPARAAGTIVSVSVFAALHSLYLMLVVTEQSVMDSSRQYARQLLLSCDALAEPTVAKQKSRPRKLTSSIQ